MMPISSFTSILNRLRTLLPAEQVSLFLRTDTWRSFPDDAVFYPELLDEVIHTRKAIFLKDHQPNLLAVPVQRGQR
ncbi:MAG: hypothetical protein K8I82_14015, partial [Anaerolineae bacterium]|nr:hypothetical protein [Anaerolineae bacterium]